MENLSRKDRKILIGLIILGIVCIYYMLFLRPVFNKISDAKFQKKTAKSKMEQINIARNSLPGHRKEYYNLKSEIDNSIRLLPQNEREPEIALQVKSLSDKNGIALTSLDFEKSAEEKNTEKDDKIMSVPVVINLTGSYEDAVKFIKGLEDGERIAVINAVKFNLDKKDSKSGQVNTEVDASFYFTKSKIAGLDMEYDFNNGKYGKPDVFK